MQEGGGGIILMYHFNLYLGGNTKRQISDRLDQSIQVTNKVLLVMADNKHIVVAGFWDKSFRIYSVESAKLEQGSCFSVN